MSKVVSIILDASERDPTQSMDFEYVLLALRVCAHIDIRFLARANAWPGAVERIMLQVHMKGQIVQSTVGQPVSVILCILGPGDEIGFGECGDGFVDAACAAKIGEFSYE